MARFIQIICRFNSIVSISYHFSRLKLSKGSADIACFWNAPRYKWVLSTMEFELTITSLFVPFLAFSLFWGNCLYCLQNKSCDYQQNHRPRNSKLTLEATVELQMPSLRGWGVEKMFVSNSLTGDVWVILFS